MNIEDMSETEKDMLRDQLEACVDEATLFLMYANVTVHEIDETLNEVIHTSSTKQHANDLIQSLSAFTRLLK